MKLFFAIAFLLAFSVSGMGQDKYKITINNDSDVVEKSVNDSVPFFYLKENEEVVLHVRYKAQNPKESQKLRRQFLLFDKDDWEVYAVQLSINEGRADIVIQSGQLIKGNIFNLYTIAFPTDPDLAGRVKLRRVKLATIGVEK